MQWNVPITVLFETQTTVQLSEQRLREEVYNIYMLGAKHGFAQSVDCPAQSVDPCFALAIHGMTHDCAIPGLRTHDEREGPLLATLPAR